MSDHGRLLNGSNRRDAGGRFMLGCRPGPGNPLSKKANQLRVALSKAVTVSDIRSIAKEMVSAAKTGDIQAAKLVFDRCLGPSVEFDLIERLERIEAAMEGNCIEVIQEQISAG